MAKFKQSKWAVNVTVPLTERMLCDLNQIAAVNAKSIQLTASEVLKKALKRTVAKAKV